MDVNTRWFRTLVLFSLCVGLSGCGDASYRLSATDKAAFKDASAEMKRAWEDGLKADQANNYLAGNTNFCFLLSQNLTTEQLVAVQSALGGLNLRMNEAAAKGDDAALKAAAALKNVHAPHR
jgi:hypothetical protein